MSLTGQSVEQPQRGTSGSNLQRTGAVLHSATMGICVLALAITGAGQPAKGDEAASALAAKPVDGVPYLLGPLTLASQSNLKQSVFVFAGRTNSGNLWHTFGHGIGAPGTIFYDNYIVGGAYQRDFLHLGSGFLIGAEFGLADRFGHYRICCNTIDYSRSVTQSLELWGGVSLRHEGVTLFDTIRVSPGFVVGLSGISNPIGQEGLHQIEHQGSAKVLFYLGFDLAFAIADWPNTELVFRVHHRSGAYGTLGGLKEGNNANVVGIRYRF